MKELPSLAIATAAFSDDAADKLALHLIFFASLLKCKAISIQDMNSHRYDRHFHEVRSYTRLTGNSLILVDGSDFDR